MRDGQKTHLSIEIAPEFADTGKAYLFGVGVTDTPASLGTGIMQFSAQQRNDHTFSEPVEADIALPSEPETSGGNDMFTAVLKELRTQCDDYKTELSVARDRIKELETELQELQGKVPHGQYRARPLSDGSEGSTASKTRF